MSRPGEALVIYVFHRDKEMLNICKIDLCLPFTHEIKLLFRGSGAQRVDDTTSNHRLQVSVSTTLVVKTKPFVTAEGLIDCLNQCLLSKFQKAKDLIRPR